MKKLKLLWQIMRIVKADILLVTFLIVFWFTAILLTIIEPGIDSIADSTWFCFATITTIGYGDYSVVTPVGRILTVFIALYGITTVAIMTGVIVSYYNEFSKMRANHYISEFLEKLEILPDLTKEELQEISNKVKDTKYDL